MKKIILKCQKGKCCVKQQANSLPDLRQKQCTGCNGSMFDKDGKDKDK